MPVFRRAMTLLAAVATSVGTLAAPVAAPTQGATSLSAREYQHQIRAATNERRAAHDRPPVHWQACVQRFAVRQAVRMADQDRAFHQDLQRVLRECGLSRTGENVAWGYSTGRAAVRAWMHSPDHRRILLDGRYRLLGVGARRSADGTWYASQLFGRR